MFRSIPSGLINNWREVAESRVKISQFSWIGAISLACLCGVLLGAPLKLAGLVCAIALVPFAGWGLTRIAGRLSELAAGNIAIFSWFIVTICALGLGGGAVSPLMIVVLLGPFSALAVGRNTVALETLVLGALAFGVSISAGSLGWADTVPASWSQLEIPLALAVLFQLGVMFWVLVPYMEQRQTDEANGFLSLRQAQLNTVSETFSAPVLLIQKSAEGRVRAVLGPQKLRWPGLCVGRECTTLDEVGARGMLTAPNEQVFQVIGAPDRSGGQWLTLVPVNLLPGQPAETHLQTAVKQAEAALTERTIFFAGLGHDLKTPLNAIIGFAELMNEQVYGPLPEKYQDYPGIIHDSGQDLMLLVEDILDLAKSEANEQRLELEPVDLLASAQAIGRQLEDQARRAGVRLALPIGEPVWAEADARAVRQIWQNLVSNAIKYSEQGGVVSMSVLVMSGAVAISVSDEGAGMDQADLDRIAKPFAQGKNSRGRAGTGLGLAVVHRFAQLHGGKVIIDTAPGMGTRIRVTLPKLDSETQAMTKDTMS